MTNESIERLMPVFRAERSREVNRERFVEALADLLDLGLLPDVAMLHQEKKEQNPKVYTVNETFWANSINGTHREGHLIRFENFHITEWIPYSPGRYYTPQAAEARERATEMISWTRGEYLPLGKESMMLGGVGSVRLRGREINGRQYYFLGATSTGISHQGIPLIVPESEYFRVIDVIASHGGCYANITGHIRVMPPELSMISYGNNIPKYFVLAESIEPKEPSPAGLLLVTVSAMYAGSYYGHDDFFNLGGFETRFRKGWTFCSFDPSKGKEAVTSAANWLKDYAGRYGGDRHEPILTNFDEHYQYFESPVEFPLSKVMNRYVDLNRLKAYEGHYGFQINIIKEINMGDTFNMSGDFHGAILNIKSAFENVNQAINSMPNADQKTKEELAQLFERLQRELQNTNSENVEQAEAVADSAKSLIEATTKSQPNKTTILISAEGLKKAAENIAGVMPTILVITSQISKVIYKFLGIPLP